MKTSFTCIMCPAGCSLQVEEQDRKVFNISGNRYPRGHGYAPQEMAAPVRNIATSIRIKGGELPLASVRLSALIPKKGIFRAMEKIRRVIMHALVHIGGVAVRHLPGTEVDMVMTKNVLEA